MRDFVAFAVLLALTGCAAPSVGPASLEPARPDSSVVLTAPDFVALQRGAAYAEANCAGCHSVGVTGESPMPAAPRFRELGLHYPVEDLAEAFAEGIDTAHPAMPEFLMSTQENSDLIAYLNSIQSHSTR